MKIALIGYGKMGKVIEGIALSRGHEISHKIDVREGTKIEDLAIGSTDVAIEFTQPEAAYGNIKHCINNGIPIVSGTTGWLDKKPEIDNLVNEKEGAFFYASNYSVGVNLFFHINKMIASVMKKFEDYDLTLQEIHHTEKKDAPSGTAITTAEKIMEEYDSKKSWINEPSDDNTKLYIESLREENVPGTHSVYYDHKIDQIEIKHTAHSREGFATGAVIAAEWLKDRKGVLGMDDMLQLQ